jgi:hypothetical protein
VDVNEKKRNNRQINFWFEKSLLKMFFPSWKSLHLLWFGTISRLELNRDIRRTLMRREEITDE